MNPCFLFDKNQSCTKNSYWENEERLPESFTREFEREIKNEVNSSKLEHLPINTMIILLASKIIATSLNHFVLPLLQLNLRKTY